MNWLNKIATAGLSEESLAVAIFLILIVAHVVFSITDYCDGLISGILHFSAMILIGLIWLLFLISIVVTVSITFL